VSLPRSVHTETRFGRIIQTRYAGRYFRSRTEARWCVFFDAMNLRWEYEPEGYILGAGKAYLPDFWIPEWRAWFEVKPMSERQNAHALVCFGGPDLIRGSMIFDDRCVYNYVNEYGPACDSPEDGVAYEAYRRAMEERFESCQSDAIKHGRSY